jgi:signal transduction histidine kinase
MAKLRENKSDLSDQGFSWLPKKDSQGAATCGGEILSHPAEINMSQKRTTQPEEAYRKQISRDLHDGIGQALNTMSVYVFLAKETLGENQQAALDHLCKLESLLQDTVKETHRLAVNLRPPVLDDWGLVPALRFLCEDFGARTGIGVHLKTTAVDKLAEKEVETALFRITQECLSNIEKHAKATRAVIELDQRNSTLTLRVRDNGAGFSTKEASKTGIGLVGIQERASLLGGHVAITSKKNHGTEVKIKISNGNHTERGANSCPHLPF